MLKTKRVVVNGYTYETTLKVRVGSRVLLPTPEWLRDVKGPTWEGVVTGLDSGYQGPCKAVISVLKK